MPSLHPRLEEPLRIGWHKSVSCYYYSRCNKRSRLFLFSATMPKAPQDYQVVVPCCCSEENSPYCISCGLGSSRQRRSHWIFFCTPIHCETSPTTTKSSRNWIIIQPHMPVISLLILTTPQLPQMVPTHDS